MLLIHKYVTQLGFQAFYPIHEVINAFYAKKVDLVYNYAVLDESKPPEKK